MSEDEDDQGQYVSLISHNNFHTFSHVLFKDPAIRKKYNVRTFVHVMSPLTMNAAFRYNIVVGINGAIYRKKS
jgi:hypothetical protein